MLLTTHLIGVPDQHPALFEHGIENLGSLAHEWAPMIEELVSDRVIWATQFDAERTLLHHALFGGKKWRKNLRKLEDRVRAK